MDTLTTVKKSNKTLVSVRAYKGDAMTLLAMSIDKSIIKNFTGFTIQVTAPGKGPHFLFNKFSYKDDILIKNGLQLKQRRNNLTDVAPLQTFRWVHTPNTDHDINDMIFGQYRYQVTPRYMIDDILQPLDPTLTVDFPFDISPYQSGDFQIGMTRGFIESQAYTFHFGFNNKTRPNKTDLIFDIKAKSGPTAKDKLKTPDLADYTYEFQHTWLGWQARKRIVEFLDETLNDNNLSLDVFAYDLDEPVICDSIIKLAKQGRARIVLDNTSDHTGTNLEQKFDKLYRDSAMDPATIARGHFGSLSHSKVFIQKLNGKPVKVLTGSTNFSTNGVYINANHVIIFKNESVAQLYETVFTNSFGQPLMDVFDSTTEAKDKGKIIKEAGLPKMTIRFSPHTKEAAKKFFDIINKKILSAKSDVLFAVMQDDSQSSILDAIQQQVRSDKVFTYGITDLIGDKNEIMLYKPESKRGIRVAGRPGEFILPPPFEAESSIPGISVHHKFVVVDFKGANPVVYCGSSNLAFGPEQNNGDNLIEIRDKNAVTVFAIEAIRLVDHFQFRNALFIAQEKMTAAEKKTLDPLNLHGSKESNWVDKYFDTKDLRMLERTLLIG